MTFGTLSGVGRQGVIQKASNNFEQMKLKKGDVFEATVVELKNTSISISMKNQKGTQLIELSSIKDLNINVNDRIRVEVLESNKNMLQLSIKKLDEVIDSKKAQEEQSKNGVNMDNVKKAIVETNNPLQYSKQLDNHIQHALDQVGTMLESFSDADYKGVMGKNLDLEKLTIELLYQVGHSNKIDKKMSLSDEKESKVLIEVNDQKIEALIDEYNNKHPLKSTDPNLVKSIVNELMHKGVLADLKNVEKLIHFTGKVDKIQSMSDQDIVHFLASDKESSVDELYKSLYISKKVVKNDMLSEKDYKDIKDDVANLIDKALTGDKTLSRDKDLQEGVLLEDEVLANELKSIAKALVKKGIALDVRAIETMSFIKRPLSKNEIIEQGVIQLQRNENPDKMVVAQLAEKTEVLSVKEINDFTDLVNRVTDKDVEAIVLSHRKVTFHELELQLEEIQASKNNELLKTDLSKTISEVSLQQGDVDKEIENLQVIRYQMTLKAAMRLSIQGVDLKNTSLDIIRERLTANELRHIDTDKPIDETVKVNDNGSVKTDAISEAKESLSPKELAVIEMKRHMAIISNSSTKSIAIYAIEANKTSNEVVEPVTIASVSKAASYGADRYDELRTLPRGDLGDRIEKAFSNIDVMLKDIGLEVTEFNQRAVEILGRNEMPITLENIEAVKLLDIQLQELFSKLMPEHIKDLVAQNIDITNEPLESLVEFVRGENNSIQKDVDEQVAKQILMMSKSGLLSNEEKDALIGVYRMIHTISASKGAALGFLVDNKIPVTLEALFDAAKVIGSGKGNKNYIDQQIDNQFGSLEALQKSGLSIKEQIQQGFFEKEEAINNLMQKVLSGEAVEPVKDHSTQSQVTLNETLKELHQALTQEESEKIKDTLSLIMKMTRGELRESFSLINKPSLGDWNALNEEVKNPQVLKEMLSDVMNEIIDNESLRNKMETKLAAFMEDLTEKGQKSFEEGMKEILKEAKAYSIEKLFENQSRQASQLDTASKAELFTVEKTVNTMSKELESQMALQRQLIREEDYYNVPVMINGELQHMSMHYFKQENNQSSQEEDMSVYFSFSTNNLGTANIRVQLSGDESIVTMYATKEVGTQQMKGYEEALIDVFSGIGLSVNKLKYDTFKIPKPIHKDQKITTANKVKRYNTNGFEKIV